MGEAEYCSRCLVEVIEKRVNKKLSAINCGSGKLGSSRMLIACESKSSLSCVVAVYLAKKLCRIADVPVVKPTSLRSRAQQPHTAVIMPKCADEAAASLLERFTSSAISSSGSHRGVAGAAPDAAEVVSIFESVTEKELELYATIKKIKYAKPQNSKYSDLKQKLQKLQARYPGTIEALAQASRQIEEIWLKQA